MNSIKFQLLTAVLLTFASGTHAQPYSVATRDVQLNGHNLFMDSFDSSDPTRNTSGHYDPQKGGGDQAALASEAGILNSINVGNVDIWGRLYSGVPFALAIGSDSSIGSAAWHQNLLTGIEPGFHTTNYVWMFPDVALPFGGVVPLRGTYNGVYYDYILSNGNYRLPSLTLSGGQTLLVIGDAQLAVEGNATLSGSSQIVILPTASLKFYVNGKANLRGGGIVNQGVAANFIYYGTSSNAELTLRISTPFVGGIYAPRTTCTISSAGGLRANMQGAAVAGSIELGADLDFHYDEALSP